MSSNDYGSQTDRELVIGTANHDERAFAALYDRYFQDIYDFALRLMRDPDAAAAVIQNTFAEARRSLPGRHVPDSVRAWLYSLALADATSGARHPEATPSQANQRAQNLPSFTEVDPSRLPGDGGLAQDAGLREAVWQSATQFGPREQALLDMRLRHGLSSAEVAEGLRISPETAESTLSTLRESFEKTSAARILLLRGRDACPELAALLQRSAAAEDSPAVQEAVQAHLAACDICAATFRAYPPPADVFTAFALVPGPAGLKEILWGNLASAAAPAAVGAPAEAHRKRRLLPILLALLGLVAVIGVAALLFFLLSGDGDLQDPDDVRSTSHEIDEPSEDNVVEVVWSRQDNVLAYSVDWSEDQFQLPDEVGDLSGDATDDMSPELDPGSWFFHLRTQGDDGKWTSTVHIGPFEIVEPEPSPSPEPTEGPEPTEEPTPEPQPTEAPATDTPTPEPVTSPTATP